MNLKTSFYCFYRITPSILTALILAQSPGNAQPQPPTVPNSLVFSGVNVQFSKRAKRLIESNVRDLMLDKRLWESKVNRIALYSPFLEEALTEQGVPPDFKYLAVQKSSLLPDVTSIIGEVGFWQFKSKTATDMGLMVNQQVDQRKDIITSTQAAARLLKRSNSNFNNWVSTLYEYYSETEGIKGAIPRKWLYAREVKVDGRTNRYLLDFFAHKIAIEVTEQSYPDLDIPVLIEYQKAGGRTLESIASEFALDLVELRQYNRWMKTGKIPDDSYTVLLPVPADQQEAVRQKLSRNTQPLSPVSSPLEDIGFPVLRKADASSSSSDDPSFYEINGLPGIQARTNDDASELAKAAKTGVSNFLKYNDLDTPGPLTPGEVYYLARKNRAAAIPYHVVREGENIWGISQLYGVRSSQLLKYNRINNSKERLQVGRLMWLMEQRPEDMPIEVISLPELSDEAPTDILETVDIVESNTLKPTTNPIPSSQSSNKDSIAAKRAIPVVVANQAGNPAKSQLTGKVPLTVVSDLDEVNALIRDLVGSGEEIKMVIVVIAKSSKSAVPATVPAKNIEPTTTAVVPTMSSKLSPPAAAPKPTPVTVVRVAEPDQPSPIQSTEQMAVERRSSPDYHTVESGQTYFSIARLYDVEVKDLLAWNHLTTRNLLEDGQRLIVSPVPNSSRNPVVAKTEYFLHKVRPGETLFRIALIYDVDMGKIKRLNNMSNDIVMLGKTMKIPKN